MRMKSLILIFIALGCGLVASIGISQVMDRGSGGGNVEMDRILVALADIDIGSRLDDKNVKLEEWPKAKVPEGAVRSLDDVKDKFANARFYKGEPLHISKVTDNSKSVADGVPEGYRALPVKVGEETVMKAISPGDKVDVMVFLKKSDEVPETGVFTILKNVRVFAVNTNTERTEAAGKGESANFRTISLLVKTDQSRDLALASQVGKILLTLRRPDQGDDELGEEITPIGMLLGGNAKLASEPVEPGSTFPSYDTPSANLPGATPVAVPHVAASMEIRTPSDVERYDWTDRNQAPVKSAGSFGGSQPSLQQPAPAGPALEPTTGNAEPISPTTPADGAKAGSWKY